MEQDGFRRVEVFRLAVSQRAPAETDGPAAGISSRVAEDSQLLDLHLCQAGFFMQFPPSGIGQRLVNPHESAWQGTCSRKGLAASSNQQDLELIVGESENHRVHGQRRPRIIVACKKPSVAARKKLGLFSSGANSPPVPSGPWHPAQKPS